MRGQSGSKTACEIHAERMDNNYLLAAVAKLEAQTQPSMILRRSRVTSAPSLADWRLLVAGQIPRRGSLSWADCSPES